MNRYPRLPAVLGILAAFASTAFVLINFPGLAGRQDSPVRDHFDPWELEQLQEGDIILRKGTGTPSDVIATVLGEGLSLSHCAIVVIPDRQGMDSLPTDRISFRKEGGMVIEGQPAVIHTINASLSGVDGVQIQDLEHFNHYSTDHTLVVVRPLMNPAVRSAFVKRAWELLGEGRPFDNRYDLNEDKNLYCSELIYRIFSDVAWEGGKQQVKILGILGFRSFLDPHFYHLVLSHNPAIARKL